MSGIRILLIFTIFILVGCNVLPGETYIAPGRYAQNYNGPSVIKETEKLINLPIMGSSATSCEVLNLQNVTETTPCTCNAGRCTVGLTGTVNYIGVASFDYRYFSNGKSSNTASGIFNIVSPPPFVSTWRVGDVSYGDGDLTVTLPLRSGFNYNFTVDWGDGNTAEVTAYNDVDIDHSYASAGDYTITISGLVETWYFNNIGDKDKLISINDLGHVGWLSFNYAFFGCSNLGAVSGDVSSSVTDISYMFYNAPLVDPDTSGWNTSNISNMAGVFALASSANPNTSTWDTSSVTDMNTMFYGATSANPDTSNWNTSNVTDMNYMFRGATSATPDTSGWNTSNVTDMSDMFYNAPAANPDTTNWNTFNVTNMSHMFAYANIANPDTSGWDTSNVTSMSQMFNNAHAANPNTSAWNTSSVTNMMGMFNNASLADPDMSGCDFSSVTALSNMFTGAALSTVNYDNMLISLEATALGSALSLDVGSTQYNVGGAAEAARSNLIANGWAITDGGSI
ncbi:MAG: hypothetical protein CME64_10750 [Halobacteriovoraceae bacterium]|nr:hypothetical protein [Halobacteriovoraceae bacterium]|tara:strand:- start:80378 stop:81907 length:1530 start_codon:yes stop_codon:yes gene_type:complete